MSREKCWQRRQGNACGEVRGTQASAVIIASELSIGTSISKTIVNASVDASTLIERVDTHQILWECYF